MKKIKELKNQQRIFNKIVKKINDSLLKDNLWNGRFIIKQKNRLSKSYGDGSGYKIVYIIEIKDLLKNITKEIAIENVHDNDTFLSYDIFIAVNDFIINTSDVWELYKKRIRK